MRTIRPLRQGVIVLTLLAMTGCATLTGHDEPPAGISATDGIPSTETESVWPGTRADLAERLFAATQAAPRTLSDGALLLRLPAADGFETNSSTPTTNLREALDRIAEILNQHPDTTILIVGHTDSIGSETYNLGLSIDRAEAVLEHLRQRGVSLLRLSADGRGEADPIADNATPEGRATNRRVEFLIGPIETD